MKRILEITWVNSQWKYRINDTLEGETFKVVDWQFGPSNKNEAIQQAQDRFGKCHEIKEIK